MSHFDWLRDNYLDQPFEIALETLAQCNAACTFCPYPGLERIGTRMPDDLIERLVDEMATFEKPFLFSPFKVSEPLLDKRLFGILEKVNEKVQAQTRIFTNGAALNWDNAEKLSWVNNLELWVSVNSHVRDVYEPLMSLSYDRMIRNLDALHDSDFPHPVNLTKVGTDEGFREFCEDRWPHFDVYVIKQDGWLGFTEADNLEIPDMPCSRWFELSITATGLVSLCCMDGEAAFPIGNVNDNTLLEIYNAPHWRDRREQMMSRYNVHPCSTCSY